MCEKRRRSRIKEAETFENVTVRLKCRERKAGGGR